ncbi:MAG: helix-turn-helix transcriptional regulator [Protaetiibacter sp.]
MSGVDDDQAALRRDYEHIALAGVKRAGVELDDAGRAALERLVAVGLAEREGDAFSLNRPGDADLELDADSSELLTVLHDYWLRADDATPDDEVLYGELGYWRHWWNMLQSHPDRRTKPLEMLMVVADDESFADRAWLDELEGDILEHVVAGRLITGRVIVPPATLGAPAEDLVEFAIALGLEVRVFPSATQFVIYDQGAVVLREDPAEGDGPERHTLTRRAAVVEPLRQLFELEWGAGIPWGEFEKGAHGILHLLALGWTDVRIASAMGISVRTVSRRVSEVMSAAGVQSRFELGMRHALQQLGDVDS